MVAKDGEVRKRIGVALQEIGLDPVQTGRELLELQCGLYGITGAAGEGADRGAARARRAEDAADRRIKAYSGGMKRRLDLASALVHEPEVLFLDEPTTGLDPASRLTVWDEVRRINREGTTVFLTTQYMEEADQLCDRLAIIDNGQIVAERHAGEPEGADGPRRGDPRAERRRRRGTSRRRSATCPASSGCVTETDALALYVEDGAGSIAEIVRRLDGASIQVGAIAVARPTLDDVFLQATGRRLEGARGRGGYRGGARRGGGGA